MDDTKHTTRADLVEHLAVHEDADLRKWGINTSTSTEQPDGEAQKTRDSGTQTDKASFRADCAKLLQSTISLNAGPNEQEEATVGSKGTSRRTDIRGIEMEVLYNSWLDQNRIVQQQTDAFNTMHDKFGLLIKAVKAEMYDIWKMQGEV